MSIEKLNKKHFLGMPIENKIIGLYHKQCEIIDHLNSGAVGEELSYCPVCDAMVRPEKDKPVKPKTLENIIYCEIPCNYDGTDQKQVEEVIERTAQAIRQHLKEVILEMMIEAPDLLRMKRTSTENYIKASEYNKALSDVLKKIGG